MRSNSSNDNTIGNSHSSDDYNDTSIRTAVVAITIVAPIILRIILIIMVVRFLRVILMNSQACY